MKSNERRELLQDRITAATQVLGEIHRARLMCTEWYEHYHQINEEQYTMFLRTLDLLLKKVLNEKFSREQVPSLMEDIQEIYREFAIIAPHAS